MADSYEINLEIQGGEQPALVMETEGGATDGASARNAEAWANGTRNGVPVEEGDPAYHNNSKYYRDSAAAIAAGDVIDDDAGRGDTMLAWSADKLVGEFSKKAPAIVVSDTTAEAVKSFTDGADGLPMGLTVGIEPVQDLHGQENPWPAGGGKNQFNPGTGSSSEGTVNGITFTKNADGSYSFSGTATASTWLNFGNVKLPAGTWTASVTKTGSYSGAVYFGADRGAFIQYPNLNNYPRTVTSAEETTGNFGINFATGVAITGTLTLWIQIESGSSASAWSPYSNVCPISGWTGAEVTRTGKNLFDKAKAVLYKNVSRFIKYGVDNYSDTLPNGDCVLDVGTYTLSISGDGTEAPASMAAYDSSGNRLAIIYNNKIFTFTTTSAGACYLAINFGDAVTWADYNIQLELSSTATSYSAYDGTTYPITFPESAGTVYGGNLTINADGTGTLVVDRAIVDLGTRTWTYIQPTTSIPFGTFYNTILDKEYGQLNMICSAYPIKAGFSNDKAIQGNTGANTIYLQDSSFDGDAVALKTSLSGVQLVYELETPKTYTLTAHQVETLKGINNLWADTGDIKAVEYPADTKLYIDGKIAELQALILENISNS